jgi:Chromo (CHRromatin Organisation MOdifier) domain
VVKIVQSALNNSPSPQRGNVAPTTAFTGREPDSPLFSLVSTPGLEPRTLSDSKLLQLINFQKLRAAVAEIHKTAGEAASRRRALTADRRALKPGIFAATFAVGDYVLVAKREFQAGEKLSLRWRGPRRVVNTLSNHVFEIEDMHTGVVTPEHASRLRFYADSALDVNAELLAHIAHNNMGYAVRALCGLRFDRDSKTYQALVSWLEFDDYDNTWEPLASLQEDIPSLVAHFLAHHDDSALASRARESLRP